MSLSLTSTDGTPCRELCPSRLCKRILAGATNLARLQNTVFEQTVTDLGKTSSFDVQVRQHVLVRGRVGTLVGERHNIAFIRIQGTQKVFVEGIGLVGPCLLSNSALEEGQKTFMVSVGGW